jgi:hypothetical protein
VDTRLLLCVKGHGRLQVYMSRQIIYGYYIISSSLAWLGFLPLPLTNLSFNPLIPYYLIPNYLIPDFHPTNIDYRLTNLYL